jgi:DNA-binding CsgD family transcriptional regulator
MNSKQIVIYDEFMGITTINYYLSLLNQEFEIHTFLNNTIIEKRSLNINNNALVFIYLNSFDSYSTYLINNEFKDNPKVIVSTIPINVYYPSFNNKDIVGYIDRNNFNNSTIKNLFEKIYRNKTYISEEDSEILLDATYFNKTNNGRQDIIKKLSLQEFIVLENLLTGKSINEIASELNLHKSSISTYKKRILSKCAVNSFYELKEFFSFNM